MRGRCVATGVVEKNDLYQISKSSVVGRPPHGFDWLITTDARAGEEWRWACGESGCSANAKPARRRSLASAGAQAIGTQSGREKIGSVDVVEEASWVF